MCYLFLLFLILIVSLIFFLFVSNIKKDSILWSFFYIFLYLCFSLHINLLYVEDLLFLCAGCFEESFIIKDPNDWVWSLIVFSFFFVFIFFIPYCFLLIYTQITLFLYYQEHFWVKTFIILFLYDLYLSLFLVLNDFAFVGIISLAESKSLLFEFQPELEHILIFILGTYFDFFSTIILFNLFLILISIFSFNLKKKYGHFKLNKCFTFIVLLYIYYWFGGEGVEHDILLILFSFFLLELIKIFNNFLFCLKRYKK